VGRIDIVDNSIAKVTMPQAKSRLPLLHSRLMQSNYSITGAL